MEQALRSLVYHYVAMPILTFVVCIVIGTPYYFMSREKFMRIVWLWIAGESYLERHLLRLHYEVRGTENLPSEGAFVVACKHQSAFETYRMHDILHDPAIVAKKELLSIPIWGAYLKKSGAIAIDRSTPEKAMLSIREGALRVAAENRPIVIFPQGTRIKPGTPASKAPYRPGVFRIYEATNIPIIPVAVNSGVYWPKGAVVIKPGTVVFQILPAIPPGLPRAEFMARLETAIETANSALEAEALERV